jgi:adenosylmethionine-8-amino-7-oxononanoate aminotransferase
MNAFWRKRSPLQEEARRHLWMHFTDMGQYKRKDIPVIGRAEGCYFWDKSGKRYLDGLSALFCANAGHCRPEISEAIYKQSQTLDFVSIWSYAHEGAIHLASRIAKLAPGDLNRVFFTSGGAESVESALKLARAYHGRTGNPRKTKFISRELAYHGTTLGALSATGLPGLRSPFEPLVPGGRHAPATNLYRMPEGWSERSYAERIEEIILFEDPDTVAAVVMEPVQNAGGCLVPPDGYWQEVRRICDRYNVLLISDEVICSWGRLGAYFGSERLGYRPDIITTAKGLTSATVPMGAMIASDRLYEPFDEDPFLHGYTFAGHPLACAAAEANLDIFERDDLCGHVLEKEGALRQTLEDLRDLPIVGDVRGMGFFQAIELVRNRETKETFTTEECDWLLRDFLSERLYQDGLICRADDRGDPVVQLAPPLIADEAEFEIIGKVLRDALSEASRKLRL